MLLHYLKKMQTISKYIVIRDNKIVINGKPVSIENNFVNFAEFIKSVYRLNNLNYPKFFKMDDLCKLAFVSSELLLANTEILHKYPGENMGVILAGSSSSLDTDIKYYETIRDRSNYFPSPAIFVYTLANILIGEICIKNKIFGENTMFISRTFNPDLLYSYTTHLFEQNQIQSCISGWIDFLGNKYESFIYLVEPEVYEKNSDNNLLIEYNPTNLYKMYKTEL
jgi:hypothetical protein